MAPKAFKTDNNEDVDSGSKLEQILSLRTGLSKS